MKPDDLMSEELYEILTRQIEYQHAIIRKHYTDYEMHKLGEPGHADSYLAVIAAMDEARQIRQQLESIMRKA